MLTLTFNMCLYDFFVIHLYNCYIACMFLDFVLMIKEIGEKRIRILFLYTNIKLFMGSY